MNTLYIIQAKYLIYTLITKILGLYLILWSDKINQYLNLNQKYIKTHKAQ